METFNKKIKDLGDLIEKYHKLIFWLIFILALILNTYKLGKIPEGVNCDEAGMTIDANDIANYGTDRFLNHNPVYLTNYGDGQSVLYAYLTAILIKIFGTYNLVIIRIPALILSMIEVVVCYLLVKEFKSKKMALCFMLMVTISPWHIMKSRWALDCNLFSPMQLISVYALIKAIKAENKKILRYVIAGLLFGITLYSYAISYIAIPIFLLIMLIYLSRKKLVKTKEIIVFAIPLIIFAIPLILVQMVQKGWINEIHSFITIPKLFRYRIGELDITKFWSNWGTLKYGLFCDSLPFNSINGFGTLYYLGTILMIYGIIVTTMNLKQILRDSKLNLDAIMLFLFISNIVIACLIEINTGRINGIFIYAIYFEIVSLKFMFNYFKPGFLILLILYYIMFISFSVNYFVINQKKYVYTFSNGATEAFEYINSKYPNKKIYGEMIRYTFDLYANPISPTEFNKSVVYNKGKTGVLGYNNYICIGPISRENTIDQDAIYITVDRATIEELKNKYCFKEKIFGYTHVLAKELE